MAIRTILTYPDPLLKQESEEIKSVTYEIKQLMQELTDSMTESAHSVGIAAPQLGRAVRLVVADASRARKPCDNHGFLVLINPEIIAHEGSVLSREGCMSVPEFTGNVNRAEKITVQYYDENFQLKVIESGGFEAILLQHEIDHLDGVLFIDRVISKRTDLFRRKK